jgi:hypothetical protein
LPRTLSISGSIAHQLSAIRFNESRLSNPLVGETLHKSGRSFGRASLSCCPEGGREPILGVVCGLCDGVAARAAILNASRADGVNGKSPRSNRHGCRRRACTVASSDRTARLASWCRRRCHLDHGTRAVPDKGLTELPHALNCAVPQARSSTDGRWARGLRKLEGRQLWGPGRPAMIVGGQCADATRLAR